MTAIVNSPEMIKQATDLFLEVVDQEKDWADYLFEEGAMIGLNAEILKEYVEYIADHRMRAIHLESPYKVGENPLPWMTTYSGSSDTIQVAPQETEIVSYLVGQIDSEVSKDDFDGFDL